MTNYEKKKELKSKKALKALYSSIKGNTLAVLNSANKSVRSFEDAYQAVTSDVSCGIIKTFNENLRLLGNVLDKESLINAKNIINEKLGSIDFLLMQQAETHQKQQQKLKNLYLNTLMK